MKLTPLYQKHLELGAVMYSTAMGYAMPAHYGSVDEEARAVRQGVGMNDVSLMGRLDVKGPDALTLVQFLIVNNAARLADEQALYSTMCNEAGLIVDDVIVFRFAADHLRVITSSMFRYRTLAWIQRHIGALGLQAWVTDVSSSFAMISVQGPRSRSVLDTLVDADLSKLGFFRLTNARLDGIPALVARLGFSGELGFECYVNAEDAHDAWDRIAEAGQPYGIVPYGMDTLDALRWEKGFIFFGFDATGEDNPYECRLSGFIDYDCGDFLGREALLKIREAGPARKLMGLEVEGTRVAAGKEALLLGDRQVGKVVAGFHSPNLDRNLGYAYLDAPHFEPGTQVRLTLDGEETSAIVAEMPFLDPQGTRMRSPATSG